MFSGDSGLTSDLTNFGWGSAATEYAKLGRAVLKDAWSILGVIVSVLVAMGLANLGVSDSRHRRGITKTSSGLLRSGSYGGARISHRVVEGAGVFCALYLIGSLALMTFSAVWGLFGSGAPVDGFDFIIVAPLYVGGAVISAQLGATITPVDRYVESQMGQLAANLENLERLRPQVAGSRVTVGDDDEFARAKVVPRSVAADAVAAGSLALAPGAILVGSLLAQRADWQSVLIAFLTAVYLVFTSVALGRIYGGVLFNPQTPGRGRARRILESAARFLAATIAHIPATAFILALIAQGSADVRAATGVAATVYALEICIFIIGMRATERTVFRRGFEQWAPVSTFNNADNRELERKNDGIRQRLNELGRPDEWNRH